LFHFRLFYLALLIQKQPRRLDYSICVSKKATLHVQRTKQPIPDHPLAATQPARGMLRAQLLLSDLTAREATLPSWAMNTPGATPPSLGMILLRQLPPSLSSRTPRSCDAATRLEVCDFPPHHKESSSNLGISPSAPHYALRKWFEQNRSENPYVAVDQLNIAPAELADNYSDIVDPAAEGSETGATYNGSEMLDENRSTGLTFSESE
jgi:hypothetical protein